MKKKNLILAISLFLSSWWIFSFIGCCFSVLDLVIFFGGWFMILMFPIMFATAFDNVKVKEDV